MIRVQTYNTAPQSVRSPGIQQTALPTVGNVADTAGTRTLASLLDSGDKLMQIASREYVKDETARVSQSLQQMNADLAAERERYMQENQGQNAIDAGQHFEQYATQLAQKYMRDGQFQGRFAEEFEKQAMGNVLHFTEQGRSYGNEQREAWNKSVMDGAISDFQNQVAQNYNNKDWIAYNLQNLEATVNAMRPGLDNSALMSNVRKAAAQNIVDGYLAHDDIAGARQALNENREFLGDGLNSAEVRIRNRADALQAKAEAQRAKAGLAVLKGYNDAKYKAMFMGDASDLANMAKQLRSLGLSEEADALQSEADMWKEARADVISALNLPLPEAVAMYEDLSRQIRDSEGMTVEQHKNLSTRAKAVSEVVEARMKAFKDDPAAAVEKSNLFQLPDNATPEDRVSARIAAQERNGVLSPVPLTNQEVERIAVLYQQSKSPAAFAAQVANEYGEQSQAVIKQLVTSGKLPPDTNLALNMSASSSELLMQMNRKDAVKETENSLGVDSYIKDSINGTVRDELSDILKTFNSQGNAAVPAQILDASYKLALKYMEQGQSVSDAAERAAREVIADRYEVRDGYRIPRIWDADTISDGADRYKERLAESGDVAMNVVPGLTEAQTTAKKRAILRNARWVNNPDESGLWLTVNGKPVLTNAGDVVQVSFDELTAQKEGK